MHTTSGTDSLESTLLPNADADRLLSCQQPSKRMPQGITATEILLRWLETALSWTDKEYIIIRSSDIQTKLPQWGAKVYDERYAPNNYLRRFREARANETYRNAGIKDIQKVELKGSREAGFKIIRSLPHLHRDFDEEPYHPSVQ